MSLVIFVVRHGYVTVLCVIYYIGHCVTRAMCCLDLVWKNLNFIHQTYSRLVKCFSLLCTNGCTSFVCGNLNHAAKTAVKNGTLTYQANLWLCIIQLVQHISLKIEGFLGIFSRRKVAKSAGYFNIFYKLSPFTYLYFLWHVRLLPGGVLHYILLHILK